MKQMRRICAGVMACMMALCLVPVIDAGAYGTGTMGQTNRLAMGGRGGSLITDDGDLWTWGYYGFEELYGDDPTELFHAAPVKTMEGAVSVAESGHYGVIKEDGSLWMWGTNEEGQIGDGTMENRETPVKVMEDVAAVSVTNGRTAAIKTDGSLWMWGCSDWSTMGENAEFYQLTPLKMMDDVASVALGWKNTAALKTDGTLWTWGSGFAKGYESGSGENRIDSRVPYKNMENVKAIAIGNEHGAAIKEDGSLWMWGEGNRGQLGNGKQGNNHRDQFTPIKIMDNVAAVSLGSEHSAAIKNDGTLWMWGRHVEGQIGIGETQDSYVTNPVKVMDEVASVSLGYDCSAAIKKDGTVWVWGQNDKNKLGIGENAGNRERYFNCQDVPVQLMGFDLAAVPQCTVWLELNGGSGETSIKCDKGGLLTPPNNPAKDGYYFAGWFKDAALTQAWNFDTNRVNDDMTLYAKWESKTTSTVIAEPSNQTTVLDGQEVIFNTYILRDERGFEVNFVKLRDVAYVLNGTAAQFNVDWRNNAIRLEPKSPYTTPNGAEMTVPSVISAPAQTSVTPVLTDGYTAPLEAFLLTDANDGGHNYFKLRDIGKVAGFDVRWDDAKECIVITTTKPYSGQ